MISNKEMEYVNTYARYAPFPGGNYASSVIDELIKAYNLFNEIYLDKEFNFIFSNGEEINFELFSRNLAHLLGIDFKNIVSDPMEETINRVLGFDYLEKKNSFEILKRIIDRADEVIKNDSVPQNFKILNYYKCMIKTAIFLKLSQFDKFNFGCINFNKELFSSEINNGFLPNSTKLLFTQSNESLAPYFMMGIKMDGCGKYIPETLFAPLNFYDFFKKQELVLPTQILACTNFELDKMVATNEEKLNLLNLYKSIINTYNTESYINIFSDYENLLTIPTEKVKSK